MKVLRDARIADASQLEQKGQVDPWVVSNEHNGTDTWKGVPSKWLATSKDKTLDIGQQNITVNQDNYNHFNLDSRDGFGQPGPED